MKSTVEGNTRGIAVASVKVSRPSLDDVYLRFAGRAFEEADSEFKEAAA